MTEYKNVEIKKTNKLTARQIIDMLAIALDCSIIEFYSFDDNAFYIDTTKHTTKQQLFNAYCFVCACKNFLDIHFVIDYSKERNDDSIVVRLA